MVRGRVHQHGHGAAQRPARYLQAQDLHPGRLDLPLVQRTLGIDEYTDPHHSASVPHTVVLAPGLVIDKVYVGYWFFGRPSAYQLWEDLQDLFRRTKADYDPTLASAREAWEQAQVAIAS